MSSYRQQPSPPPVCRPPPFLEPPRDIFIPLADRYPIPPPPEEGSLQQIIASHPRLNLYLQPRRWTATHLDLLNIGIIDEDEDGAVPVLSRPFADLEPMEDDYDEVISHINKLPTTWNIHGAQNAMHFVMDALTRAVLSADGDRTGKMIRGKYKLKHTLHIFYANIGYILRPQEVSYNRHHGYRIPLYPLTKGKSKAETQALSNDEDRHRLVWAYLGPADVYLARESMRWRGDFEWEVEPYVVGVLIQLAQEAARKKGWKGRDEIEVSVFVAEYSDDDEEGESNDGNSQAGGERVKESTTTAILPTLTLTTPSDDPLSSSSPQIQSSPSPQQPAPPIKLTQLSTTIHTSFLNKFSEPRKFHEGELLVFMKSWPVREEFVGDIFEAVAEATLSEGAVGEWERGVVRVEEEESVRGGEEGEEGTVEESREEGERGVKRKAGVMSGGMEQIGREELKLGESGASEGEDAPACL